VAALLSQIRESLWGMGIPQEQLQGLDTKNLATFKRQLQERGINDTQFNQARAAAEWRVDSNRTPSDNLSSLLRTMGYSQDQVNEIIHTTRAEATAVGGSMTMEGLLRTTVRVLGPVGGQVATNLGIKLGQPEAIPKDTGFTWNPLRKDAPKAPAAPKPDVRPRPGGAIGPPAPPPGAPGAPGAPGTRVDTTGVTPTPGDVAGAVTGTAAALGVTDTTPALGPGATEDQVRAYVNKHYGQYAYLYDVPELKEKVIRPAVEAGWGADEVLGALQATGWWKKTESSARLWLEKKYTDPADAADQVNRKMAEFQKLTRAKGITVPGTELREMAEDAIEFGWDDNETTAAMGRFFRYDPANLLGEASDTAVQMRQLHKAYLIPLSDATVQTWTEKVMRGEATTDDFEDYLAIQAKALFPMLSKQIDLGVAPDVWVNPYREIAAQTLGISPDAIDFRDPKWMRALDELDPKTNQRRPMYLNDWSNLLKTDDAFGWDQTEQGRAHGASLAANLAKTFGRA
jgi:hypothetical protein